MNLQFESFIWNNKEFRQMIDKFFNFVANNMNEFQQGLLFNFFINIKFFPLFFLFGLLDKEHLKTFKIKKDILFIFLQKGIVYQSLDNGFIYYGFNEEIKIKNFKIKTVIAYILEILFRFLRIQQKRPMRFVLKAKKKKISDKFDEIIKKCKPLPHDLPYLYIDEEFIFIWKYKWKKETKKLKIQIVITSPKWIEKLFIYHLFGITRVVFLDERLFDIFFYLWFSKSFLKEGSSAFYLLDYVEHFEKDKELIKEIINEFLQKKLAEGFFNKKALHVEDVLKDVRKIIKEIKGQIKYKITKNCLMCEKPIEKNRFCKRCYDIRYLGREFFEALKRKGYLEKYFKGTLSENEKKEVKKFLDEKFKNNYKFETYEDCFKNWIDFNKRTQWQYEKKVSKEEINFLEKFS